MSRAGASWSVFAVPSALGMTLLGVAWFTRVFDYAVLDVAALAVLYLSLAFFLHAGALALAGWAAPLGLVGSLSVGAVVMWHLREQGLVWLGPAAFAGSALVVGLVHFSLVWRQRAPGRAASALSLCVAAALVFGITLVASFGLSNTLRWQILRQNTLIGTPAYYLLAEPVPAVREAVWTENQRRGQPAPPVRAASSTGPDERPDIVFVLVDTLRADALSAYGGHGGLMPAVERFAARSVVFRDVVVNATWTRPSVASFFTGLLPEEHGAVDRTDRLAEDWWVLAEALRDQGYETAAFVSNYGAVGRDAGFAQGFDHFEEVRDDRLPYARADRLNAAAVRWLRGSSRRDTVRRPLFLYLHYLDPHVPYLSGSGASDDDTGSLRAAYDAELRYLDARLSDVFELLDEALEPPRVVFFTSDHGEEFREHGSGGHGHSLYSEVVRVPAILQTDGRAAEIDARLEARDFFDLLLGLSRKPDLDVVRWARERTRSTRYMSIWNGTPRMALHRPYLRHVALRGIEQDGYFLIWSAYGDTYELYDRRADPAELQNLVRRHPDRVRSMGVALDESVRWWAMRLPVQHRKETVDLLRQLGYVE